MTRSHPVLLILFILSQTIFICMIAWFKLKIRWFSYILFLIFLGGLIVLFVYITRLASNELIFIRIYSYAQAFILNLTIISIAILYLNQQPLIYLSNTIIIKTFNFIYSWNSIGLIILTIIYLLLTLIIVVKISNKFEGPIKNLIFK